MKSKIIYLTVGIFVGLLSFYCTQNFLLDRRYKYVELKQDYKIEGVGGVIKKGTILKVDQGMSEGFTRYILFLNIKGANCSLNTKEQDKSNLIIPFWLNPIDTLSP